MDKRDGTELVCQLPKGWSIRFYGDIVVATHPLHFPRITHLADAAQPFFQWPGMLNGESNG